MAYYDYEEDRPLIKGAFCASFGMLPQDFENLTYADYIDLFPSINGETTFAGVIRTRMETKSDRIKEFSQSEYAEWIKYKKKKKQFDERQALKNQKKNEELMIQKEKQLLIAKQRLEMLQKGAK